MPNIIVPAYLMTFGQALRPCLEKVERTLYTMYHPPFAGVDGLSEPGDILDRAGTACGNMDRLADDMMTQILANPNVTVETTYRYVGRFEGNLDNLLNACEEAIYIDFHDYPEAKRLLLAGLGNLLEQIRDWLKDICDTIDDPLQAYQNRPYGMEDGTAVFSFNLVLKAPPEFKQLHELTQHIERSTASSGRGFWNTVGTLVLGFAVADWLFDDD